MVLVKDGVSESGTICDTAGAAAAAAAQTTILRLDNMSKHFLFSTLVH